MGGAAGRIVQVLTHHEKVVTRRRVAWGGIWRNTGGARFRVDMRHPDLRCLPWFSVARNQIGGREADFEVAARGHIRQPYLHALAASFSASSRSAAESSWLDTIRMSSKGSRS